MVLIFINDIPANLECKVKVFADDISLFSLVHDPNENSAKLGRDSLGGQIAVWAYQGKVSSNLEPSEQVVKVHFFW